MSAQSKKSYTLTPDLDSIINDGLPCPPISNSEREAFTAILDLFPPKLAASRAKQIALALHRLSQERYENGYEQGYEAGNEDGYDRGCEDK